ncbi:hypothetical protein LAZ67_1006420 [Cordylochernes scorpioides]|uniref:Tc1-like transposase DDE domain-containing protein n=1 Tax=Cordylochernes scorpioides TaxID=51811 RepID=A0ABY6JZS7_9ARAC|nr:hypothetical protein LAZ67_1006420 [Cordylochernes scorpioides]
MEQRAVIKFNAKLGRSASETYILMKQVYGTLCLSKSNVFIWHKPFSDGRNTLEDDKHTGRPSSSKTPESIEKVREFVANIRRASLRMMAEVLHINKETIRTILHEDWGIVNYEYLEEGQTINKESYLNIMRRVHESIRLKRSEMWSSKNWIIYHDNAPSHTAASVLTYLAKHGIQILQQPPYSPDLAAPNDFFLFPKLKMALKGRRFDTRESIIADSKKVLKNIPKDAFSKCFKSWEKR